jgi:esterase/lipase superfamily enzyme
MKDAFVFIHGYNVSFEDAARRTGQFAYDLKFVGAPIFTAGLQRAISAYYYDGIEPGGHPRRSL